MLVRSRARLLVRIDFLEATSGIFALYDERGLEKREEKKKVGRLERGSSGDRIAMIFCQKGKERIGVFYFFLTVVLFFFCDTYLLS